MDKNAKKSEALSENKSTRKGLITFHIQLPKETSDRIKLASSELNLTETGIIKFAVSKWLIENGYSPNAREVGNV